MSKIIPDNESGRGGPSMLISCLGSGLQDLGSREGFWEAGAAVPRTWALLPDRVGFKSELVVWTSTHGPSVCSSVNRVHSSKPSGRMKWTRSRKEPALCLGCDSCSIKGGLEVKGVDCRVKWS